MDPLPYYHVQKGKKTKKKSYGIICITKNGKMVLNQSVPYIYTKMCKKEFKQRYGYINLNTNEKYNLDLNLFPNATLEGEFTLPKGQIDHIDNKNCILTKIREFIEETKYTHPTLEKLFQKHYENPNFKSFLNDPDYMLHDKYLGLDGKIYECEYSIFVIDSIKELIPINGDNNIVPFKFFIDNLFIHSNYESKDYKNYQRSSKLDQLKKTIFISIENGIYLINKHKIIKTYNNWLDICLKCLHKKI